MSLPFFCICKVPYCTEYIVRSSHSLTADRPQVDSRQLASSWSCGIFTSPSQSHLIRSRLHSASFDLSTEPHQCYDRAHLTATYSTHHLLANQLANQLASQPSRHVDSVGVNRSALFPFAASTRSTCSASGSSLQAPMRLRRPRNSCSPHHGTLRGAPVLVYLPTLPP